MARSSRKSTRGFVRHGRVVEWLRDSIVQGRCQPGGRLPAHVEIEQEFGTTPVTVQRALQQLRTEGFIRTRPNAGTYVADFPPHLWRYGLVIDQNPQGDPGGPWSRFYQAMAEIVGKINPLGPRKIELYTGVNGHLDSEEYQRLLADLSAHRIAGLMFAFAPHVLVGTPVLDTPGILRAGRYGMRGRMPAVSANYFEPFRTAMRWIAGQGRRDLAVITLPQMSQAEIQRHIEDTGLRTRPFWVQAVTPYHTEWVRHAVYGILHSNPSRVPDAMLVTDDHLVEAVADALVEFGVRVPDDMLVVGHWNFPLKFNRDLPVQLIGLDNVELLRRWVMSIDAQRRGEHLPADTFLAPILAGQQPPTPASAIQELPPPHNAPARSTPRRAMRQPT